MSVFTTLIVTLKYGSGAVSRDFTVARVEDDSFKITRLLKKGLFLWTEFEKFIGWRRIITVRFRVLSAADLSYLLAFCIDADNLMQIIVNGITYNVQLVYPQLSLSLLDNYIHGRVIEWKFTEALLNRTIGRTYAVGSSVSGNDKNLLNPFASVARNGTCVQLTYNYGDGDVTRQFYVNLVNSLNTEIQRKNFEYIDYDSNVVNLGQKVLTIINFSPGGAATEAEKQDDRDWIREFCLAPTKIITPSGGFTSQVVNDFEEVNYTMEGGLIYGKSTQLAFRQCANTNVVPVIYGTDELILDEGTLDEQKLG